MCHYKQPNNPSFNEKHLVFYQGGPPNAPTLGEAVQDSLANIINAAARVVSIGADLLGTGAKLLDTGVEYGKDGVKMLIEWHKDPGKPTELPEHKTELPKYFNFETDPNKPPKGPESTGDPVLDRSIKYHLYLAYLTYKSELLVNFLSPAMDEFRAVHAEIEKRKYMRSIIQDKLSEVTANIVRDEAILKSEHLLKTDPERNTVRARLNSSRLLKIKLEQKLSVEVQLNNKPQHRIVEFPPKSGVMVQRFEVEKGSVCVVNLEKYHIWLARYLSVYEREIQGYKDEMEKLAYYRDLLAKSQMELLVMENPDDAEIKISAYFFAREQINRKLKSLKEGIKFEPSGTPESIVELETVGLNPTGTSSPGGYEQRRKDFLEKFRARRNGPAQSP